MHIAVQAKFGYAVVNKVAYESTLYCLICFPSNALYLH